MPEPVTIGLNITGDARSGVRAFDDVTAAAKRTETQAAATVARAQAAWSAPNPATRVESGMQSTGQAGRFGQLLAQGGLNDLLGQAGVSLPGGAGGVVSALGGAGTLGTVVAGAAAVAGIIAGIGAELNEAAKIADKLWGAKQGDPRQATSAQDVATDIENAGRGSTVGTFLHAVANQVKGGAYGLATTKTPGQQHADAVRKMIAGMDPAELLTAIPLLSGDDQRLAQDAYNQATAIAKFKGSYTGKTAPHTVVINTAVLGSTQDAMAIIQRAQRNNANQVITSPRAP